MLNIGIYYIIMSNSNSSINNLIGTFATVNTGTVEQLSEEMVCIDTSNNRIGINTLDPSCSIHVVDGTIKTKDLVVDGTIEGTIDLVTNPPIFTIPNSTDGLITGQLYTDNGTLKIVP